jgi:hypothetical protein
MNDKIANKKTLIIIIDESNYYFGHHLLNFFIKQIILNGNLSTLITAAKIFLIMI